MIVARLYGSGEDGSEKLSSVVIGQVGGCLCHHPSHDLLLELDVVGLHIDTLEDFGSTFRRFVQESLSVCESKKLCLLALALCIATGRGFGVLWLDEVE